MQDHEREHENDPVVHARAELMIHVEAIRAGFAEFSVGKGVAAKEAIRQFPVKQCLTLDR